MNSTENQKRKVLIIAYYFPPLGMGGVQRVCKFVKYLPSFGWEPVVLTVKDIEYFSQDHSLLQELPPGIKIHRTGSFDPLRLVFLLKKLFQRKGVFDLKKKKAKRFFPRQGRGQNDISFLSSRSRGFRPLLKFSNLFSFPDNKIGWLPFALIKGFKLYREEKFDLLFSTSPPLTCHLVGFFLKKITGIKWVADYRDPYLIYEDKKSYSSFKKFFLSSLQKLFLKNGDGFVGVNHTIAQGLKEIYPESKRIAVITNGYDQEDFNFKVEKSKDVFKIIYFGTFSPDCPAEPFLKALHNLLQQGKIDKDKLRFTHVGLSIGIDIQRLIDEYGLKEVTELKGYLPHKEGVMELLKADLALLTVAESAPVITTGKIYEYLGAKKPILAIVPPNGEAGRMVESLGAGRVISPGNISEIENAILSFYRGFESGKSFLKTGPDELKKFEKKYLTSKLAQLFDVVLRE